MNSITPKLIMRTLLSILGIVMVLFVTSCGRSEPEQYDYDVVREVHDPVVTVQISDEASLIEAIVGSAENTVIEITQNIPLRSMLVIPVSSTITLSSTAGNTFSLIAEGNFDAITVENGATLTIDGISILRSPNTEGRGIQNWGELLMYSGLIADHINPNTGALGWGGGVLNNTGAIFHMRGGTISNNEAINTGGGVHNHGRFVMTYGNITNNIARLGGGVVNRDEFEMEGGNIIGNAAQFSGGVGNEEDGIFTMSGGSISQNTVENNSGGVGNTGTFNMRGGEISSNIASLGAGGVGNQHGTFTLYNGTIRDNSASSGGGGVYNLGGTVIMESGLISYNETEGNGAGVYNTNRITDDEIFEASFQLIGGSINLRTRVQKI